MAVIKDGSVTKNKEKQYPRTYPKVQRTNMLPVPLLTREAAG